MNITVIALTEIFFVGFILFHEKYIGLLPYIGLVMILKFKRKLRCKKVSSPANITD